jgi:hypothetical protein
MQDTLRTLVAAELAEPVDPRVSAMAAAVAGLYPGAARAVLFYGSCLRQRELDGLMLDFYLIVSDYGAAYGRSWRAPANRLIPPNVFPFEHDGLVAKYAVLSEADFYRLNGPETLNVSVWARFAQPSRLVWAADEKAAAAAVLSVARAAPTLLAAAAPFLPDPQAPLDMWRGAFALTYGAELRAERRGREGSVVDAEPERYLRLSRLEDQPPRRNEDRDQALAAALAADRRYRPAAAAAEAGGHSLGWRARAPATATARAATVKGLRNMSWPLSSSLPASPT